MNDENLEMPKKIESEMVTPVTPTVSDMPAPVAPIVQEPTVPVAPVTTEAQINPAFNVPIEPQVPVQAQVPVQNQMPVQTQVPIEPQVLIEPQTPVAPAMFVTNVPVQSALDVANLEPQNNFVAPEREENLSSQLVTEPVTPQVSPVEPATPVTPAPLEEPATVVTNNEPFKATTAPVITADQINANNLEDNTNSESVELDKKMVVEEAIVPEKVPKKKGNMFVGFLIVFVILGAIGYCVYYAANHGIINIPGVTTTTTSAITSTTTTTTAVKEIYGTYSAVNSKCATTPMNLSIVKDGTFSLSLVDDTCNVSTFSGTYVYNKLLNNITLKNNDGTSLNASVDTTHILINYNSNGYNFTAA